MLTIREGVVQTPIITPVIEKLKPFFTQRDAEVISGLRNEKKQFETIIGEAEGVPEIASKFDLPNVKYEDTMEFEGETVPVWQVIWSMELNNGLIINPPVAASALLDYIRDGVNKKGQIIHESPHKHGNCVDIKPYSIVDVIQEAMKTIPEIVSYTEERKAPQNCCHLNCRA